MKKVCSLFCIIFLITIIFNFAFAQKEEIIKTKERFASTKNNIVNVRTGPGIKYPIKWQYTKRVPVKIISQIGNWREIVDWENQTGWINSILLSKAKLGIINHNKTYLMKSPQNINRVIAYIEKGKVVKVIDCDIRWCKINTDSNNKIYEGWVEKIRIWGFE